MEASSDGDAAMDENPYEPSRLQEPSRPPDRWWLNWLAAIAVVLIILMLIALLFPAINGVRE
jgi:hypothetical protein